MENISKFLEALPGYGLKPTELFVTADLYVPSASQLLPAATV